MLFNGTDGLYINNIVLQDAPFYTLQLSNVNHSEIHDISIVSRRTNGHTHGLWDLTAFNTDGIDVAGHNIHIHDVDIWNQDDCIAVKDNYDGNGISSNMTFERITASGLGLVIGSIAGTTVQNITFRDSFLYNTFKGIYMKFRLPGSGEPSGGLIQNVRYENIVMESPSQWPIWIGPAQQAISANPCHASPCSLCWPSLPLAVCQEVPDTIYRNISLVNVTIRNPSGSPGVIMGNVDGILFENVEVAQGPQLVSGVKELKNLFPSLTYPVNDTVTRASRAVVSLLATIMLLFVLWRMQTVLFRSTHRPTHDATSTTVASERPTVTKRDVVSHVLVLLMLSQLVIILIHTIVLCPKVRSPSHYFVCEGQGGLATGTTFPVPECFEDRTDLGRSNDFGGSVGWYEVLFALALIVSVLIFWRVSTRLARQFRDRDSAAYAALQGTEQEEQVEDDLSLLENNADENEGEGNNGEEQQPTVSLHRWSVE